MGISKAVTPSVISYAAASVEASVSIGANETSSPSSAATSTAQATATPGFEGVVGDVVFYYQERRR